MITSSDHHKAGHEADRLTGKEVLLTAKVTLCALSFSLFSLFLSLFSFPLPFSLFLNHASDNKYVTVLGKVRISRASRLQLPSR